MASLVWGAMGPTSTGDAELVWLALGITARHGGYSVWLVVARNPLLADG